MKLAENVFSVAEIGARFCKILCEIWMKLIDSYL